MNLGKDLHKMARCNQSETFHKWCLDHTVLLNSYIQLLRDAAIQGNFGVALQTSSMSNSDHKNLQHWFYLNGLTITQIDTNAVSLEYHYELEMDQAYSSKCYHISW